MANPIAEAFVAIRPDFTNFTPQLQAGVNQAFRNLKVPQSTQGQLAGQMFGPGFVQQTNQQINRATGGARVTPQTQRSFAQQLFGPGFRNEAGRAIQGGLSGIGLGNLAAQFAFFGPGGAAVAAAGSAAVVSTVQFARFEEALNLLQETTRATTAQMEIAADVATELGEDMRLPGVTATDAALAMLELGRAGLSIEESMNGVAGALQLATAAGTDAGTAARIVASALNAFSLSGTEAVRVADLLAGASIAAQGDINDMALALQQSAAVADQAGLKVDELVGFITLLAQQGIRGSDAGTSIRTSLLRLVPTTKEAASFMEALGIQIDRTRTLGEQLPDLLDQYQVALGALDPTLRQSVLTQIAGTDAIRALSTAVEAGSKGFEQARLTADRQNAALDLASARTKGLSGDFGGLASSAETLAVELGEDLAPAVEASVELMSGLTRGLLAVEDAAGRVLGPVQRLGERFAEAREEALPFLDAIRDISPVDDSVSESLEKARESGEFLAEALQEAIDVREKLVDLGVPTKGIDREIQALREQLRALREEQGTQVGIDLASPLEQAVEGARNLKAALEEQGAPAEQIARVQRQIDFLTNSLAVGAAQARETARETRAAVEVLVRGLDLSPTQLARLRETVREEGPAAGRELGRTFMDGFADGITQEEATAIRAAQRALDSVVREGEQQVIDSIRSARENLLSVGDTLSGQIEEIIDLGPIGDRIRELQEQLDAFEESVSRRQLRFDLSQAEQDLREAQEAIAQVGKLTPEQKRSQEEFLAPFRAKVQDSKAALKEFDLTEAIEEQEALRDAAVKASEEGLTKLIDDFEDGRISADAFSKMLRNQLRPQLDLVARENLGLTLEEGFLQNVQTLVDQAKALSGFLNVPGTAPGAQVVRPATTQAQVNQRIAETAEHLRQLRQEAKTQSTEEKAKMDIEIGLLKQLVRLLGGSGSRTKTGTGSGPDRPGSRGAPSQP